MATHRAIAAVSATLKGILDDARPPELSGADVMLLQLTDFHKATPIEDGISILLYRVIVGSMPRTLSGRPGPDGRRKLPALPVDLYYLLTPWGRTTLMEHLLLGWAMRALEDMTILNAGQLNYYGGPDTVFVDGETVCIAPEPLALQDLFNLWDSLKPNPHVSVAYVARLVLLDSERPLVTPPLVQSRNFDLAEQRA